MHKFAYVKFTCLDILASTKNILQKRKNNGSQNIQNAAKIKLRRREFISKMCMCEYVCMCVYVCACIKLEYFNVLLNFKRTYRYLVCQKINHTINHAISECMIAIVA